MNTAATAFFQLVRLPNLFTAMADILAGAAVAAWGFWQPLPIAALLSASAALYGGGCALNDWRDRDEDADKRPNRPIPSGRISPKNALAITMILLAAGTATAFAAGIRSGIVATALLLLIVLYDCRAKKGLLPGAVAMGGCRGLNLLLGMSIAPIASPQLFFPLCHLVYVAALTVTAAYETNPLAEKIAGHMITGLVLLTAVFTACLAGGVLQPAGGLFLFAFAALVLPPLSRARRGHRGLRPAVKRMILGIVLLDALYAAGSQGMVAGLAVTACLVPSLWLGRLFSMT